MIGDDITVQTIAPSPSLGLYYQTDNKQALKGTMSGQWAKHQVESKYYSGSLWRPGLSATRIVSAVIKWPLISLDWGCSQWCLDTTETCATVLCHNNRWGGEGWGASLGNQATWGNHHVNHCLPTVSIDKYYHSGDHSTAPSDHCDTRLANESIL